MRRYQYLLPGAGLTTKSEDEIMDDFYGTWCDKMLGLGLGDKLSRDNCIADWCVINMATEIEGEKDGKV